MPYTITRRINQARHKIPQDPVPAPEIKLDNLDFAINCAVARNADLAEVYHQSTHRLLAKRRNDFWRSGRGWRAPWKHGEARAYVMCKTYNLID